jgi:hypothetical protein
MKMKDDVILAGLDIRMRIVLITADKVWKQHGQELVITSGLDGCHSAGSLHPYGYALDLRIRYFITKTKQSQVCNALREALPEGYQVIQHSSHCHVEFDQILRNR